MRDFPPPTPAFTPGTTAGPDTRSAGHLMWWFLKDQAGVVALACVLSVAWTLPGALTPFFFGKAIDTGIVTHDFGAATGWVLGLLAVTVIGAASGAWHHTVMVRSWVIAAMAGTQLVTNKSAQLGHVLARRSPTGEVLSVAGSDTQQFGVFTEIVSRFFGNLVAYVVVAVVMLATDTQLGLLVLLIAPLLVVCTAPLLRPMQKAQTQERSRNSELTSMATDIVAGLRILRGIGGEATFGDNYARQSEQVKEAGIRAGTWGALIDGIGVLFSGLFVVLLMYLGVQHVSDGSLSVGALITFLGYSLFLLQPIRTFFEFIQKTLRTLVSARKALNLWEQTAPWPTDRTAVLDGGAELVDAASGLRVPGGSLTMVVSAVPDESAALADRLGRYLPTETDPLSLDGGEDMSGRSARAARKANDEARAARRARDEALVSADWGVTLGGVDLADAPIEHVRETILVNDTAAAVFAGSLQNAIDPHRRLSREQAEAAMMTAAAEDVYDAVPGGWSGVLDERGRGLSGGQRQRLVLARAIAADPEVLVLVEPTSAVDAHTEAMVAQRLPEHRAGRTTVVMTASPLLLHHADRVALMSEGRVIATGTHEELVAGEPAYRRVVLRGEENETETDLQEVTR